MDMKTKDVDMMMDVMDRREDAGARFADAYVLGDGTVHEYGGQCRTWPSVEAFHEARGWRAAALFFPVNGRRRDAEAQGAG